MLDNTRRRGGVLLVGNGTPGVVGLVIWKLLIAAVSGWCVGGCQSPPAPAATSEAPVIAPLPVARHGHRAHAVDERVYALGGFEDGSVRPDRGAKQCWRLDRGAGEWTRVADMPTDRVFFGSVVMRGRILAIGGGIDAYDPAADSWTTLLGPGVFPETHFGAAAVGSRIYALGGFPARSGGCVGYDAASKQVLDPPEPPGFASGDHFHILATLRGELHVIGGLKNETFTPTAEHWVLRNEAWAKGAPPPRPLWLKFSIVQESGDRLYIFEGDKGLCYDAAADRWSEVPGRGVVLAMPASIAVDGHIVVLGGLRVDEGPSAGIEYFSMARARWLGAAE